MTDDLFNGTDIPNYYSHNLNAISMTIRISRDSIRKHRYLIAWQIEPYGDSNTIWEQKKTIWHHIWETMIPSSNPI